MANMAVENMGSLFAPPAAKDASASQRTRRSGSEAGTGQPPSATPPPEDSVDLSQALASMAAARGDAGSSENETSDAVQAQGKEMVERIRDIIDRYSKRATALEFQIDREGGAVVVKVVSKESGKLVRQIPPDEFLKLQETLQGMQSGGLLSEVS